MTTFLEISWHSWIMLACSHYVLAPHSVPNAAELVHFKGSQNLFDIDTLDTDYSELTTTITSRLQEPKIVSGRRLEKIKSKNWNWNWPLDCL